MDVQANQLKQEAAAKAVEFVESGMVLGLGSGSTTKFAVDFIGQKIQEGHLKNIIGIPTSEATAQQALALNIQLGELSDYDKLDLAIDGADEIDPHLNLTKGWGGALVREKLVEVYAKRLIIIADESKLVQRLGTRGPVPVEVVQFAWQAQAQWLSQQLDCQVTRREHEGQPYVTDNQNFILHCYFDEGIADPYAIQAKLADGPGLVGHGLFLDMATEAIISMATEVKMIKRAIAS